MTERVLLEEMSARIRERQEAGRLHREEMYQRKLAQDQSHRRRKAVSKAIAEDVALGRHAALLASAKASATGELAALVAEQERDERSSIGSSRLVRLDALDRYGRSLYETLEAKP